MTENFYDLGLRSIHRADLTPIDLKDFYVVTCISNSQRYKSRNLLYRRFAKHMQESGVKLFTVELAYGDRPFEITEDTYGTEIRLRTRQELWHKENMLNVAMQHLPKDWKYVAWVDADITFMRPDWAHETVQQLQHYDFVQMFSTALDIGPHPDYGVIQSAYGFMYCYHNQLERKEIPQLIINGKLNNDRHTSAPNGYYGKSGSSIFWHPGYCWAARRSALIKTGGLLDTGALGAGDHHMALGMIGQVNQGIPDGVTTGYRDSVTRWQNRCLNATRKNIGYVPGTIHHAWHGSKANRKYWDRWKILVENSFDPYHDLMKDPQGMYQLVDHGDERSIRLRDQIRAYFRQRDEDSNYNGA
jgi:hypothetical protein